MPCVGTPVRATLLAVALLASSAGADGDEDDQAEFIPMDTDLIEPADASSTVKDITATTGHTSSESSEQTHPSPSITFTARTGSTSHSGPQTSLFPITASTVPMLQADHPNTPHSSTRFQSVDVATGQSHLSSTPQQSSSLKDASYATMTTPKNNSFNSNLPTTAEQAGFTIHEIQGPSSSPPSQAVPSSPMTSPVDARTMRQTPQYFSSLAVDLFDTTSSLDELVCPSDSCLNLCGSVLRLMDHTAQPCEDFYQYACGGLRHNPELSNHDADSEVNRRLTGQILSISGTDNSSYGQLKKIYDSCLVYSVVQDKTERIREVITEVRRIGWFHTKESWEKKPVDITQLLANLFKVDSTPLFDILLDEHETNSSKFVLKLVPPVKMPLFQEKKGTLDKNVCNLKERSERKVAGMKTSKTFEKFLESFPELYDANSSNIITETLKNLQENIIEIIEKYLPFEDYFRWILVTKKYEVMTLEDLQHNFNMVNWTHLISKILAQTVDDATELQIYYKSYFERLFHYLSEIDFRLLHNSLLVMFTKELYEDVIIPAISSRKEYCLTVVRELLPDVAGSLYLRTFPRDTAGNVQRMFDQVKQTVGEQVNASRLLDAQSKTSVLKKLATLSVDAGGGRDVLGDSHRLKRRMEGYDVSNKGFLANYMSLRTRKRQLLYALFSKDASEEEQMWTYFVSPLQTQAPLLYHNHRIVVPYAMLPRGGLGTVLSWYSAAELGVTLARMIVHHFDFTGIHIGQNGTEEDIVSPEVYQSYLSDMKHQASEKILFMDKSVCKHRRSHLLLANDFISDQAALNMALRVFTRDHKTMKELQLFFLAMTQASCEKQTMWDRPATVSLHLELPLPVRVNDLLAQSPHFSLAFRCSMGSDKNFQDKTPTFL